MQHFFKTKLSSFRHNCLTACCPNARCIRKPQLQYAFEKIRILRTGIRKYHSVLQKGSFYSAREDRRLTQANKTATVAVIKKREKPNSNHVPGHFCNVLRDGAKICWSVTERLGSMSVACQNNPTRSTAITTANATFRGTLYWPETCACQSA